MTFGGSPLAVTVGSQGQLQAKRDGDSDNIFFAPRQSLGDAGFFLAFPPTAQAPAQPAPLSGKVFGFNSRADPFLEDEYWPVTQSPTTGDGSAGQPIDPGHVLQRPRRHGWRQRQRTTRTSRRSRRPRPTELGAQTFTVAWSVKNVTAAPLRFKAISAAADFFFEGSDRGTGIFTQGPPRFVGGTNADTGRSGGFVEMP